MNYGKVEERSSSRSRSPNTARRAATSAILTDILSRSDRAPTSRTADARPGKCIFIVPVELSTAGMKIQRFSTFGIARYGETKPLTQKQIQRLALKGGIS